MLKDKVLRKMFGSRHNEIIKDWRNYIMRSFLI
jgi:hypothetical protein